jgi:hypothetical protein
MIEQMSSDENDFHPVKEIRAIRLTDLPENIQKKLLAQRANQSDMCTGLQLFFLY